MRLIAQQELLNRAKERFVGQYSGYADHTVFMFGHGKPIKEILNQIKDCVSFEQFHEVIGHTDWQPTCTFCTAQIWTDAVFHNNVFEEDLLVCPECVKKMRGLLLV